MINVMQAVYAELIGSTQLVSRLSTYLGQPAIFMDWAQQVEGPYIVLTYLPTSEVADTQVTQTLQVDIFERGAGDMDTYTSCILIREDLVKALDRLRVLDGAQNLRVYYNSEQPVPSDDGRYRRYLVSFVMRWNRTADL